MSLPQALAKLEELSKKADPEKKGISYTLDPALDKTKFKTINLNLVSMPTVEIAGYIAALSGLELKAEENKIILKKKGA